MLFIAVLRSNDLFTSYNKPCMFVTKMNVQSLGDLITGNFRIEINMWKKQLQYRDSNKFT